MNEQSTGKHAKNEAPRGSFLKTFIVDILIALVLAGILLYFIRPTIVKQNSMENTLMPNDYVLLLRQAYKSEDPERGDIIVFKSDLVDETTGDDKLLIKRIIGLPGDEISISDDQLYINGEAYEEDYLAEGYTPAWDNPSEGETLTVPEGEYYVMGDNRAVSIDSRSSDVGTVSKEAIEGKAWIRLFPLNKITKF